MKLWLLFIAPLLGGTALAQQPPHEKPEKAAHAADKAAKNAAEKTDKNLKKVDKAAKDKQQNAEYSPMLVGSGLNQSQARQWAAEYGMTGKKALPPGIRKQLAKGKPLPTGLSRQSMPAEFEQRLPAHSGYEWRVVGTDLVLVSIATQMVADVLMDVLR